MTKYIPVGYQDWTVAEFNLFLAVRNTLEFFDCPNGDWGWTVGQEHKFENAGFKHIDSPPGLAWFVSCCNENEVV